jgi:hypothetical protein
MLVLADEPVWGKDKLCILAELCDAWLPLPSILN